MPGHICPCLCCALASLVPGLGARGVFPPPPASSLCDGSGVVRLPPPGIISGSWPSCRCWPRHGRGLGKARPTGLVAAAPSLGCHLQVPHVQSSQGPAGEGQPHTYSQKRAACLLVELRTPPSPCQLATAQGNTVKAALISDPAPAGPPAGP